MDTPENINLFLEQYDLIQYKHIIEPLYWSHHGWWFILKNALIELIHSGWNKKLNNIKKKWGLLFIQIYSNDEIFEKIIFDAKQKSKYTCEICSVMEDNIKYTHEMAPRCEKHKHIEYFYYKNCKCNMCTQIRKEYLQICDEYCEL
jgi:hypothetical protein